MTHSASPSSAPLVPGRSGQRWHGRRPAAWSSPGFRALTRAWVFTNLADSALFLMAAVWVKDLTQSDGAAALVFAALGLSTLFAPLLGQLADRMSRRLLLVITYAGIAAIVMVLLTVRSAEQVWVIFAVVLVYGAVGCITGAAQAGLLRDLLPDDHLASGNGMLSTVDQSFRLVSPLAGAALYAVAGPHAVVVATATLFAVAAVLM